MTKLIDLGVASEETKGQFLSLTHIDSFNAKKVVAGVKLRSKPTGPDQGSPTPDPA